MKLHVMTPKELLQRLIRLVPDFANPGVSLTTTLAMRTGGVCGRFTDFYRGEYESFPEESLRELSEFIGFWLVEPDAAETPLDNALCTCFLEKFSSEPYGEALKWFI